MKRLRLATEGIMAIDGEPSSFDNVGRKGLIVDALLAYDINNPVQRSIAERMIEAMPWLKGDTTTQKLTEAQGED